MSLIQDLQRKYPKKEFFQDPVTAVISFVTDEVVCTDPFLMDDGRFPCKAEFHGLEVGDAIKIVAHNMPLEMCHVL